MNQRKMDDLIAQCLRLAGVVMLDDHSLSADGRAVLVAYAAHFLRQGSRRVSLCDSLHMERRTHHSGITQRNSPHHSFRRCDRPLDIMGLWTQSFTKSFTSTGG